MKKDNKGIALINIILLVLIIICIVFIAFFINNSNEVADINNDIQTKNIIERSNIKKEEITENVALSNNIVNGSTGNNTTSNNEANKFYYRQLNNIGKSIYDTLLNNIQLLKSGTQKIDFEIEDANAGDHVQAALDALFLDNPNIFWIDILKISFATRTTTFLASVKYNYYIEPKDGESNYLIDSFKTQDDVQNAINAVENKIYSIASRANGTTYDKVKFVHDEIINLMDYDESLGINSSNIYGALVENSCVCEGYAESFKAILDVLKIPCITVYGNGIDIEGNTEAHAWNYVKMDDGKWYAVDTTWDDPIVIGGNLSRVDKNKYFLKGARSFAESHVPDGNVSGEGQIFEYPTLSEIDY